MKDEQLTTTLWEGEEAFYLVSDKNGYLYMIAHSELEAIALAAEKWQVPLTSVRAKFDETVADWEKRRGVSRENYQALLKDN